MCFPLGGTDIAQARVGKPAGLARSLPPPWGMAVKGGSAMRCPYSPPPSAVAFSRSFKTRPSQGMCQERLNTG